MFLKIYRQLRPGTNIELEVGRYLTEVAHFPHSVPVAGALEYTGPGGVPLTLALLQAYVPNQGDGWTYTVEYLVRYLEQQRAASEAPPPDVHGAYLAVIRTLGRRTAELHLAFASSSGNPAFDPEPLTGEDLAAYKKRARDEAAAALRILERSSAKLPSPAREEAQALHGQQQQLLARIDNYPLQAGNAVKIRVHGDYHLAQVLIAENDFRIIDFEGEPARPLAERRAPSSPLRDVAGMLRSLDYAARTAERTQPGFDAEAWLPQARSAFLAAHGGIDPRDAGLLAAFELEKACYEVRYEASNRPEWLWLPLAAFERLASSVA
jgi:maltose alpha-D-glucosyltransferase/alpha-amylase